MKHGVKNSALVYQENPVHLLLEFPLRRILTIQLRFSLNIDVNLKRKTLLKTVNYAAHLGFEFLLVRTKPQFSLKILDDLREISQPIHSTKEDF
jgi:hypothetical protein